MKQLRLFDDAKLKLHDKVVFVHEKDAAMVQGSKGIIKSLDHSLCVVYFFGFGTFTRPPSNFKLRK